MANFVSRTGPTDLENARVIIPNDYADELFNDMGFVVRAKTDEGEDVYLWMFMYRQQVVEVILNNEVCQTLLVNVAYDEHAKMMMHDAPYHNKGQNIDDYHKVGTLQCTDTEGSNQWSLAGRVFYSEPSRWKVTGDHANVKVDLDFSQRGDAFYNGEPFSNLRSGAGQAAFIVHCWVKGTISVGDKTLKISHGHGIHERICMAGHVPARLQYMLGRGMNWIHSWGDRLSFYLKTADRGRSSTLMFNVDDKTLTAYGGENAWVE